MVENNNRRKIKFYDIVFYIGIFFGAITSIILIFDFNGKIKLADFFNQEFIFPIFMNVILFMLGFNTTRDGKPFHKSFNKIYYTITISLFLISIVLLFLRRA